MREATIGELVDWRLRHLSLRNQGITVDANVRVSFHQFLEGFGSIIATSVCV